MTPKEVETYYGTSYRFGKTTGMSANTLRNWLKWGFVPEDAQYKLERITKGVLKADEATMERNETLEEILSKAHEELKESITKLLFKFTDKYYVPGSKTYTYVTHVIIDVLNELIENVKSYKEKKNGYSS